MNEQQIDTHAAVEAIKAVLRLHPAVPLEDVMQALRETHDFKFPDAMRFFAERQNAVAKQYAAYAHANRNDEGNIEVDATAIASISEDRGAYVLAWLWVDQSDVGIGDLDQQRALLETEEHE